MNSKKLVSIFGLALALVLGVMIFGGRTTRAVAPVCTVGPAGDYTTIQDAVNDTACTTINVSAGTYNESVTIGRPLILNGPNVGVSAFAPRGPEATVNSAGTTFNLTDGQNVTIDGFTISGVFGVYPSTSTTGLSILNNIISGTSRAVSLDAPGDGASLLNNDLFSNTRSLHIGGGTGPHTNLKINGNRFSGPLASTGIFFSGTCLAVAPHAGVNGNKKCNCGSEKKRTGCCCQNKFYAEPRFNLLVNVLF